MRVFSLVDPRDPLRVVDLFAENPVDFEGLWARAERMAVGRASVRVASIEDLIRLAGRPEEELDVEALEAIRERREGGS